MIILPADSITTEDTTKSLCQLLRSYMKSLDVKKVEKFEQVFLPCFQLAQE